MMPVHHPLCVLSVGRSGTSLAARAVNLLGLDLGPEERMPRSSEWNPRGFWEQQPMMDLNDAILAAVGGSYYDPPELARGWESDPALDPLRVRARALVDELFGGAERWCFKDPRTVLTLPFWRTVIGEMDYLVCVRDPLEVAASLIAGGVGGKTREHYLELWLRTNAMALRETEGSRRAFVHYDDWFRDGHAVARRLAALVHGTPDALDAATWERISAELDPALRRQRVAGPPLAQRGDVPPEVATMDVVLRALTAGPGPEAPGERGDLEGRAAALGAGLWDAYGRTGRLRRQWTSLT
jgi:hypothetical protein